MAGGPMALEVRWPSLSANMIESGAGARPGFSPGENGPGLRLSHRFARREAHVTRRVTRLLSVVVQSLWSALSPSLLALARVCAWSVAPGRLCCFTRSCTQSRPTSNASSLTIRSLSAHACCIWMASTSNRNRCSPSFRTLTRSPPPTLLAAVHSDKGSIQTTGPPAENPQYTLGAACPSCVRPRRGAPAACRTEGPTA